MLNLRALYARYWGRAHCFEHHGDRVRVFIGNLALWSEYEEGSKVGHELSFAVNFADHIGAFDTHERHWPNLTAKKYLSRSVSAMVGRYGFLVSWRGREIQHGEWIPKYQLKPGWDD